VDEVDAVDEVDEVDEVRVLMDAQSLSTVAAGSGTGSYVRHLLAALVEEPGVGVTALCGPDAPLPDGVTRVPLRRRAVRLRAQVIEHAVTLPFDVWRGRPSGAVFHNPTFHAPAGVRGPWVQTLHDLIPLLFDTPDVAALRARWKRFGPRYRRADAVIAISQHAADEGVRLLGLDPSRVHVAWHGIDPSFRPGVGVGGVGGVGGLSGPPYLLVVSEFSARKGFAEAFAVMDALVDAGYPHRLVVAGRVHSLVRAQLTALHAAARHPERIELSDFVPDLISLYQGASAFLMSSRYEGFGFPALEAMACGVPVVAFANSAVTEVVSGGGCLVEDGDVEAMTAAVRQVLDSPALAEEWRQRGLAHAATFTWARSAAIHAEVYRSVAGAA